MVNNRDAQTSAQIHHFSLLKSTNGTAREGLSNGKPAPFWIIADEQTDGRGRQGREWVSLSGNLFTSLALSLPISTPNLSVISLLAGLALRDAINDILDDEKNFEITLKWPNDLVINNAKLAGILIENQNNIANQTCELVIGYGLNIGCCPVVEGRETTCLHNWGQKVNRDQIFQSLIKNNEKWLDIWQQGANVTDICENWLSHSQPIGTAITVKHGNDIKQGQFFGLDESGSLKLKQSDGTIDVITAGELIE